MWVDLHLGHKTHHSFVNTPKSQLILKDLLKHVADAPLCIGIADTKGKPDNVGSGCLNSEEQITYLGPVAMGQHDVVTGFNQIDELFHGGPGISKLFLNGTGFVRANQ